jgi:hypothetical protein
MKATTLVRPVECPRCVGNGNLRCRTRHLGISGLCFQCDGKGKVEGDPATLKAIAERHEAFRLRNRAFGRWERAQANRRVVEASNALRVLEPARHERLIDSIVAGHPGIEAALLAYLAQAEADLAAGRITV